MEEKKQKEHSLIDFVFSWSLEDVLNKNLYRGQLTKIPTTFSSVTSYVKSFVAPLIAETHADLCSSMAMLSRAPMCETRKVRKNKDFKAPNSLYYDVSLKVPHDNRGKVKDRYEPECGDLLAFTNRRPKSVDDLISQSRAYTIGLVYRVVYIDDTGIVDTLVVRSSKPLLLEDYESDEHEILIGTCLVNMTTSMRIWTALHPDPEKPNILIKKVLQNNPNDGESCVCTLSEEQRCSVRSDIGSMISSFQLNHSQEGAIWSCLRTSKCLGCNSIKLIWGPPGTGKTKTVGVLLFALLKMRYRTVTCTPTNVAVLEVASRLMRLVLESLQDDTHGLGDILLFGNTKRMRIDDDHEELFDVFLDHRVELLYHCLRPLHGWKATLSSMTDLLNNPKQQYRIYLENRKKKTEEEDEAGDKDEKETNMIKAHEKMDASKNTGRRKRWKQIISQALKKKPKNRKEKHPTSDCEDHNEVRMPREGLSNRKEEEIQNDGCVTADGEQVAQQVEDDVLTFNEFFVKRFEFLRQRLETYVEILYTHMPTSLIPSEVVGKMIKLLDLLKLLKNSLSESSGAKKCFRNTICDREAGDIICSGCEERNSIAKGCLEILNTLPQEFGLPALLDKGCLRKFCMGKAVLLFCTASSSAKLDFTNIELLVIDEAAQLKECESAIPLQLPGLRHAVLIGDEHQLPAMVQSKTASDADYGRSLFERLVLLEQKKHLLDIQYRMHPSISLFPNREFYDGKIWDAPIVREKEYEKHFLQGRMYGPYSFINISCGKEQFGEGHSLKNQMEVAVVSQITSNLFKVWKDRGTKLSVGVISPYKAQVHELQEKVEKKYKGEAGGFFNLSVRSVDGFQGGEEDVIIISTVRCNGRGSVGFLSNRQRANVALTRARHCLWILGNEATLVNSGSVWAKVVLDAKQRHCFHNAESDKSLSQAITYSMIETGQLNFLLDAPSLKDARWRVQFSDEFRKSLSRIKNPETRKQILTLLENLSHGWRLRNESKSILATDGTSSQLCHRYRINKTLELVWAVDIIKEKKHDIQVLKVWDILAPPAASALKDRLDIMFENYTVFKFNRCKHQCCEGEYVVPMRWPVDLDPAISSMKSPEDHWSSLALSFPSLCLED